MSKWIQFYGDFKKAVLEHDDGTILTTEDLWRILYRVTYLSFKKGISKFFSETANLKYRSKYLKLLETQGVITNVGGEYTVLWRVNKPPRH